MRQRKSLDLLERHKDTQIYLINVDFVLGFDDTAKTPMFFTYG